MGSAIDAKPGMAADHAAGIIIDGRGWGGMTAAAVGGGIAGTVTPAAPSFVVSPSLDFDLGSEDCVSSGVDDDVFVPFFSVANFAGAAAAATAAAPVVGRLVAIAAAALMGATPGTQPMFGWYHMPGIMPGIVVRYVIGILTAL